MGTNMCTVDGLVLLDYAATKKEEVISELSDRMRTRGLVTNSFKHAALTREQAFPTGLSLETCNIAVPHTDTKFVTAPCMGMAVLRNTVPFRQMDDTDKELEVKLVFLIALSEPHSHIDILRKIICTCNNKRLLNDFLHVESLEHAICLVNNRLIGE